MGNQYKEWTRKEIIKAIQDFYEVNQKTPRTNEFLSKNNLPSYSHTLKILNCSNLEEIFNQCDLTRTEYIPDNKIDRDWALEQLKMHVVTLDKIPTREDFKRLNLKPYYDYYTRNFGTLKNACYLAGLIEKPLTLNERVDLSIKQLQTLASQLNKCPTVYEYDTYNEKGLCRRELEKKLNLKYNDICKMYIPQYSVNLDQDISQKEIINTVTEIYNRLGRPPMFIELKDFNCTYSQNLFNSKFGGTYNQFIRGLGWTPTGTDTLKRTEDEMLDNFYNYFKELKRVPNFNDLNNRKEIASSTTYINYFGSIENVCNLLNIDYNSTAGWGKYCFDNLGNLCKSYLEADISNYFINKNVKFDREPKYSEIIPNCKKRFDWKLYIDNKVYYVEYFGMYSKNSKGKIMKKYLKRTKKKIKLLYKYNVIDKCILIFPWDIKNKSFDEIFKNILYDEMAV